MYSVTTTTKTINSNCTDNATKSLFLNIFFNFISYPLSTHFERIYPCPIFPYSMPLREKSFSIHTIAAVGSLIRILKSSVARYIPMTSMCSVRRNITTPSNERSLVFMEICTKSHRQAEAYVRLFRSNNPTKPIKRATTTAFFSPRKKPIPTQNAQTSCLRLHFLFLRRLS
jgi:hypothetical protein